MGTFTREERIMRRVIGLAKRGIGMVSPNPLVGAVLFKDGVKIGEGFHQSFGGPHAEVNAIGSVESPSDLRGAELFVNLEPCSHWGKTPPCTRLIIESGIRKVYIANTDPFPQVNGEGIRQLREAGIDVVTGVMEQEGAVLNRAFFTAQTLGRPWVTIKVAMTLDGRISTQTGESKWITSEGAREDVQWLRFAHDGILTGAGTVRADDPALTIRLKGISKQPWRLILDSLATLPATARVFSDEWKSKTLWYTTRSGDPGRESIVVHAGDGKTSLNEVMRDVFERGIHMVLVEAGPGVVSSFIREGLADELIVYVAPKLTGNGPAFFRAESGMDRLADSLVLEPVSSESIGPDTKLTYRFRR